MTTEEQSKMAALEHLIDMTAEGDWYMIHGAVREDVVSGRVSPEFETAYAAMIDRKCDERGLE